MQEKRKQRQFIWIGVLSLFYLCLLLAGYCCYKELSWENVTVGWIYLEGLSDAFNRLEIFSSGINDVVNLNT